MNCRSMKECSDAAVDMSPHSFMDGDKGNMILPRYISIWMNVIMLLYFCCVVKK
jgi:hypothetical protein